MSFHGESGSFHGCGGGSSKSSWKYWELPQVSMEPVASSTSCQWKQWNLPQSAMEAVESSTSCQGSSGSSENISWTSWNVYSQTEHPTALREACTTSIEASTAQRKLTQVSMEADFESFRGNNEASTTSMEASMEAASADASMGIVEASTRKFP